MFGVRGTSDVGTAEADAPPTSEKVNPAAPNMGTVFATRFRFEVCFTPGIVASSIPVEKRFEPSIVPFANVPCKVGWCVDVPWVPDFMFVNGVGSASPASAMRQVGNHRQVKVCLVTCQIIYKVTRQALRLGQARGSVQHLDCL